MVKRLRSFEVGDLNAVVERFATGHRLSTEAVVTLLTFRLISGTLAKWRIF